MLDSLTEGSTFKPHPVLVKALDVMLILHAEHEMNCSTAAMMHISSSRVDPYSAIAGAAAALYGPLHGGANEAVLRMLEGIGSVDQVGAFVEQVKRRERRLMGFGHRVYKNYDPRAKIIQDLAHNVFAVTGHEPLIEVAVALERFALSDPYFIDRRLYPNVDFYSGLIYKAMGFPTDYFPVLFALPRIAGWLAHWREQLRVGSGEQKIWRPLQVYTGDRDKEYVPVEGRSASSGDDCTIPTGHPFNRRYLLSMASKI
jgi:citrate synthase